MSEAFAEIAITQADRKDVRFTIKFDADDFSDRDFAVQALTSALRMWHEEYKRPADGP